MVLNIRDKGVDQLAKALRTMKTQAVKPHELDQMAQGLGLEERLRPLQDRIFSLSDTSHPPDKSFFDGLDGNP